MKKKDRSVGVVPIFQEQNGTKLFLLVLHGVGHWAFPKGHSEAGEDEVSAAKRELYEETGVTEVRIDPNKEFLEHYCFEKEGQGYDKTVRYFVGLVSDKQTETPDEFKEEIEDTKWVDNEEAKRLLTFPEAQRMLQEVTTYLKSFK